MERFQVKKTRKEKMEEEYQTNGRIPETGVPELKFGPDDMVKTCKHLESGLRLGPDGIRACCMGAIVSPLYWSAEEASKINISKEMIIEKRKALFSLLNDDKSFISCKRCSRVETKRYADVDFTKLGLVNLAHFSMCNLRCKFCGFTQHNEFVPEMYDALSILKKFSRQDVQWDSYVDLNGGEPTLLKNLDEYIDYFKSRGIRILLYTNGVKFRQFIFDGLASGAITYVITSLDAGTPSSFKKVKKRDYFFQVIENLTRYADAGARNGGMLAVKYIFCEENCSDDDIAGFTYAMLAIRPQKVWLTFDFFPLADKYDHQEAVGVYDYSMHEEAYVKMFLMMKKHGLEAGHFARTHLAAVHPKGKALLKSVLEKIEKTDRYDGAAHEDLFLKDFRKKEMLEYKDPVTFQVQPLRIHVSGDQPRNWSLSGKRVLLAPAYDSTASLLADPEIRESRIIGFLDRNPVLQAKDIQGFKIHRYEEIPDLTPDVILVAPPEQHQKDILGTIGKYMSDHTKVALLEQ